MIDEFEESKFFIMFVMTGKSSRKFEWDGKG